MTTPLGGAARRLGRLETAYLRLVDPPPEYPLPRLEVWICEPDAQEATNPHTGETRPVAEVPPGPFTLLITIVHDREA